MSVFIFLPPSEYSVERKLKDHDIKYYVMVSEANYMSHTRTDTQTHTQTCRETDRQTDRENYKTFSNSLLSYIVALPFVMN